jgi:enediyne biosynthesis protein E4
MLLLNRGSRFEERPLPLEAQISPGFAVCVADFDGDGNEDVFLSQNFFATNPEMVRSDAGRGLLLQGNGRGELKGVAGQQSGIKVYGEQRGAAVADFDGDGRVDLVVTQNGAETKLFHNRKGKAGVRVRLEGGLGNPQGVGAKLRVKRGGELGPVREVQSGSGYWSQNSAMQILAAGEGGELIVQWPHGNWTTNTMPGGALEVLVSPDGIKQSK